MTVRILLFAGLRQLAGKSVIELELPGAVTVETVRDALFHSYPELRTLVMSSRWAIHDEFISLQTAVTDGDELTIIPPVSGG